MLLTAVLIAAPEGGFTAFNPETGSTSQGDSVDDALANLREATELYLEECPQAVSGQKAVVTTFEVVRHAQSLPHLSGADVVKVLERLGFSVVRRRGSHIVMRSRDGSCVVPDHRELKIGTLAGVLRQANVSAEAFLQAMK